ncbi:probable LRR receptor-like serine/threonine-protein kinase At1g14390 [Typha angustifolia]|uniref:probable LRR receptor-like serine/threonine-protein kinase At1g14390 n=1 Tax=Typha angustifolia TaxID=59011 RepID=UPI003C30E686
MQSLSIPKPNSINFSLPVSLLFLLALLLSPASAQQLSPSQSKTLLRLQRILEYPQVLSSWTNYTNFCYLPQSSSLSITCLGNRAAGITIVGGRRNTMSPAFSSDALFTTLTRLPSLTSLSLVSLGIWGPLPGKVDRFTSLQLLNLSSNFFYGEIPQQLSIMSSLQNLILASNSFNGTVPDLKSFTSLSELDLSSNRLGPDFPSLSDKSLSILVLKGNNFHGSIPMTLNSFTQLQKLDLSSNKFVGQVPSLLFSLPSIQYLDFSSNKLTGQLSANLSCGARLRFIDISNNLLIGALPSCISSNTSNWVVLDSGNCLSSGDPKYQHPNSYCNEVALAAVLPPPKDNSGSKSNLGLILGIVGGIIGGAVLLGFLMMIVLRRARADHPEVGILQKPNAGKASIQVAPRTPADKRHASQAVMVGSLGATPYRVFTLEEIEEATNSFDSSNLIKDGPQGQYYKGWLQDGSMVLVRCLKLKQKYSPQNLVQYMDTVAKLRHRHLVSVIGHCIATGKENANTTTTVFLVSECVTNGTLRSHLTEWRKREMLKWPQRVTAVIGVARGIQFLHTVTVPGIVGSDLTIENILLDQTLTAKISNYNLPVLPNIKNSKVGSQSPFSAIEENDAGSILSMEKGEKEDIYQLGLILLEIITGKPVESPNNLDVLKVQLQKSLIDGSEKLKGMTDPSIRGTFAVDSLRTAVEITLNCVSKNPQERPSIDDVLWHLQYSVQVQDGWASSENVSIQI